MRRNRIVARKTRSLGQRHTLPPRYRHDGGGGGIVIWRLLRLLISVLLILLTVDVYGSGGDCVCGTPTIEMKKYENPTPDVFR